MNNGTLRRLANLVRRQARMAAGPHMETWEELALLIEQACDEDEAEQAEDDDLEQAAYDEAIDPNR